MKGYLNSDVNRLGGNGTACAGVALDIDKYALRERKDFLKFFLRDPASNSRNPRFAESTSRRPHFCLSGGR